MGLLQEYLYGPLIYMGPQQYYYFRGPWLLKFNVANQFKRITRVKLSVPILKVANCGSHLTFL